MKFSRRHFLFLNTAWVAVTLLAITPAFAADDTMASAKPAKAVKWHYLEPGKPDATKLLPPPPLPDSPEQAADLAQVRAVHATAASNDLAAAYSERKFTIYNFTEVAGAFLVETNLSKVTAFFAKVQSDASAVVGGGKNYFQRPRPFVADPSLVNGYEGEKSYSYPSGHSTESMVLALVLSDLLPDQREAIVAHARAIGWRRVQIARHYYTDVFAGRVLAEAIVKQFKKSDAFEKDFAAAKAELEAARK